METNPLKRWMITITVIMATLLELIDTTIVNVSLPQIMGNLGATLSEVGWIVTGYAVANVIILPMSAWLSLRFGRKNYFMASITVFTISSFFCGEASSIEMLVFFRIIQGLAGGGLLSTSQTILVETWPKEQIGMATALFGLGVVVGPTIGPTIGGYITYHLNWSWIFFVNIPLGILALAMSYYFIKATPGEKEKSIDWWGILFLAIGIGSLQVLLEKGEEESWLESNFILTLIMTSTLGIIIFIWRELSIDNPIVNFKVLKDRDLAIGMVTSFILGVGLYASVFIYPIFAQNLLGFTSLKTGELLFPGGLATIFMMPIVGILLKRRFPPQILATIGFILFFVFTEMLAKSTLQTGENDFFLPLIIRGIGMSLCFVPLTSLALSGLEGKDIAQGAGINNMMRQLGGSFGIAIITTMINKRVAFHRGHLVENISDYNPVSVERFQMLWQGIVSRGIDGITAKSMTLKSLDGIVTQQSYLLAYMDGFYIVGFFMLMAIPFIFLHRFNKEIRLPMDAH
ncbi:MAG: DHA2 family efflux MFS transporter permease subunit [Chitinophagales bacterium]|nr:DHA2 family efflux MFS transporter permease subunit [Chitinophagales bacterium]